MSKAKILNLDELKEIITRLKLENKKVILSHGDFDLLHIGHIRYLKESKKFGDVLVVTVTPDKYIVKGPNRPEFNEKLRAEAIAALDCVDYVLINKWPTAKEIIKSLKPDIYSKGIEYKHKNHKGFNEEANTIKQLGGKVRYTNEIVYSATNLINKQIYREEVIHYLERFKAKYNIKELLSYFDRMKKLKVLVIGDLVIDEYFSGEHLGKMRRESIVEFMAFEKQRFIGGSGIIANHLSVFVDKVDLMTLQGEINSEEEFINEKLNKNIGKYIFTKKDSPTPIKTRFIEENVGYRNLFKVTQMNDQIINKETSSDITSTLDNILPKYDVVLVSDFGHGMIDSNIIEKLTLSPNYLAVNTQINTENKGYNTIDKYPRVNYGCINMEELRLVNKDKYGEPRTLLSKLMKRIDLERLSITSGYEGCFTHTKDADLYHTPAISIDTIDTLGAGDAFFAITSPLVRLNAPMDMVGFIGNVVGSIYIKILGNQRSIQKNELFHTMENLLK
jgi:rfaE bifunctional protein nucleotidyltransferase chain/domain